MSDLPETSRGVVYDPDTGSLEVRTFPIRPVRPGEILVRVSLSAICGSDLHTISGRRRPRGPIILGHEICGTIAALGDGLQHDSSGTPLAVGDRVTWSIAASCGKCFFCTHGIPQKCESLFKYGHESIDVDPPLNGGFAEHVYLAPGTAVYRIPDALDDDTVVFANCSLATMAAAMRLIELQPGESILIQGAGLVGVCAAALAAARGAGPVAVVDVDAQRLERAKDFGATHIINAAGMDEADLIETSAGVAGKRGFDAAIEACGRPDVVPVGLKALRIGGRYVIAGCVFPGATAQLDLCGIITRLARIIGLHNYAPTDLEAALAFLNGPGQAYPFDKVVDSHVRLDEISSALQKIDRHKDILRIAVRP
ncbi:MAG: zinc-binding dehydrogenase [Phycisphaerae bacterium]|nr:zinc-binding dehydrogenase [Phycisphaerae bacterium]